MSGSGDWVAVAAEADVAEGQPLALDIDGRSIALFRVEGEIFCTDNVCTHEYALLSDGWLEGHVIECPLHAGQFDVRTGKGLCPPIEKDLAAHAVKVEGGEILVRLAPG
jgi:nitrite reductase/ring-hydroxylating ferredoxin subunit